MTEQNLDKYQHILVVDLEATCCDSQSIPRHQMETIEIGAVMVDTASLKIVDEFQTFIKPLRHPMLTEFCNQLTSITQSQVNTAPTFPEAIELWQPWLSQFDKTIFGSWGDYDRKQLQQDGKHHRIDLPDPVSSNHVNLKELFSITQGFNKRYGMAQALNLADITLTGTHHRGIDDARNISKLLPYILGRQKIIKIDRPSI
ncbi:3'-5' exonuclease [Chamaesiphon sp. GL140_3_metabinner_50]|uniref:3'-5' exonuclease n=1 Tax=Chamaesiphon sp. GL140_3_metabinner_50 TaxID=2970812 RepID=UPI0025FD590B|nr:3'-5' exonuclease [Chamaesiphon sp. GL140_3_metabinner_50]